jgi:hypothetical protein
MLLELNTEFLGMAAPRPRRYAYAASFPASYLSSPNGMGVFLSTSTDDTLDTLYAE